MQIVGQHHAVGQNPSLSALNHPNTQVSKVSRVWNMAKPWISKVIEAPQLKETLLSLMPIEVAGVYTLIKVVDELKREDQPTFNQAISNTIQKYVPSFVIDALGKVATSTLTPVMSEVHHVTNSIREKITGREELSFERRFLLNEGEWLRAITTIAISPVVEESLTQGMRELSTLLMQLTLGYLTDLLGLEVGHAMIKTLAVDLGHVMTQVLGIVGSAITFGLAHENNIHSSNFKAVFIPGLLYSLMYADRGLLSAIATHSLYNSSLLVKDLIIPRLQAMQLGNGAI